MRAIHPSLRTPTRTLRRCLVCGFAEVETDEVIDRGLVLLHQCPWCEHRWTSQAESTTPCAEPVRPTGVARLRATSDRELPDAA